ncbi:MAG: hypothetical protein JWR58_5017 [Pseudonocardia sp.]|jgi:hypothetical protein|nr:hypothetical protein [Pseudonocardia sp.]
MAPGSHDAADRACTEMVSEPGELSLDAAVSPPGVLLCQADDQFAELIIDGWPVPAGSGRSTYV